MSSIPLLLVSGWATTNRMWDPFLAVVGPKREVVKVSWDECLRCSHCLVDALSSFKERPICIGWSVGGMLALQAANEAPNAARGYMLISTTARLAEDRNYVGVSRAMVERFERDLNKNCRSAFRRFCTAHLHPLRSLSLVEELCNEGLSFEKEALLQGLGFLMTQDFRGLLSKIHVPCCIVHGQEDRIIPWKCGEYLGKAIPHATFDLVPSAGHALPITQAPWIARILEAFAKASLEKLKDGD